MNKKVVSIAVAFLVVVFAGLTFTSSHKVSPKLGNIGFGEECNATTSAAIWANVPHVIATTSSSMYPDIHTLCSVIIGTTDATAWEIRDATSSTDVASTSIFSGAASIANGTNMPFNVSIKRGLIINTAAAFSAGRYTFTYR